MNIITSILFIFSSAALFADLPKGDAEYQAWQNSKLEAIEAFKNTPSDEAIPQLGKLVWQLNLSSNMERDDRPVFRAAQSLLISIPGHAEYFRDQIKRITEEQIAGTSREHSTQRAWHYQTLEQLPSPETVRVLGELLLDERDPWKDKGDERDVEAGRPSPNSTFAVITLNKLGIKNAPVKQKKAFDEPDVKTWQLWFEQVKAGTQTFSFNGDPQEYTLKGSVIGKVAPTEARSSRDVPSSAQAPEEKKKANLPWFALTAAALLVAVGAWLVRKNRVSRKI